MDKSIFKRLLASITVASLLMLILPTAVKAQVSPVIYRISGNGIILNSNYGDEMANMNINGTIEFTGIIRQEPSHMVLQSDDLRWNIESSQNSLECEHIARTHFNTCTALRPGTSVVTLIGSGRDGTHYTSNPITVNAIGHSRLNVLSAVYENGSITLEWTPTDVLGDYTVTYEKVRISDGAILSRRDMTTPETTLSFPADSNAEYRIVVSGQSSSRGVESDTLALQATSTAVANTDKLQIIDSYHTGNSIGLTWNEVTKLGDTFEIGYKAYDMNGQLVAGACCIKTEDNFYRFSANENLRYEIEVSAKSIFGAKLSSKSTVRTLPQLVRSPSPATIEVVKGTLKRKLLSRTGSPNALFVNLVSGSKESNAARYLANRGVIDSNSVLDKNFRLNRAQAAKLLVLAGDYEVDLVRGRRFSDVDSNAWFTKYINAAVAHGIMAGMGDGTFRPNDEITAEEFNEMLRKAFDLRETERPLLASANAKVPKGTALVTLYEVMLANNQ